METESGEGIGACTASIGSRATKRLRFPKKKRRRRPNRKWFGRKPQKQDWATAREPLLRGPCALGPVHGDAFAHTKAAAADHVVPERLVLKLCRGKNPHASVNLMGLCRRHHGLKTSADRLLCKGDKLGFLAVLRKAGWPMEKVEAALAFYKL